MCRASVAIPTAAQLRSDISHAAEEMRESITKDLEEVKKVSLAIDAWTSTNKLAFLAIIAYWIDKDWNYHHVLIGFEQLSRVHDGENFGNVVTGVCERYKITDKLFAITTDNASNNGTMANYIKEGIVQLTHKVDYEIFHIPCLAHVIQLAVKAFTDELKTTTVNDSPEMAITNEVVDNVKRTSKGFHRTLTLVRKLL